MPTKKKRDVKFLQLLSTVKIVAGRLRHRLFPERQLYFRANGVVRFVSLSPRIQMGGASIALLFVCWVMMTSVNFILRDSALAAKEQRIEELARSYDALDAEMRSLQVDVLGKTRQLKERQNYLHELINQQDKDAPPPPAPAATAKPQAGVRTETGFMARILKYETAPGDLSVQVIKRELARLESHQQDLARNLVTALAAEIDAIVDVLQSTGMSKEGLFRQAFGSAAGAAPPVTGQGGPFIAPDDGKAMERLARSADEDIFANLARYHGELQALYGVLKTAPFVEPLEDYYVSSSYGQRRDPFNKRRAFHHGADMAAWSGSPIKAGASGRVKTARWKGAYGNLVEIDHGNGFVTRYGHLRQFKVKVGQTVSAGDVLGLVGSTGRSSGPHLHYEIWFDGKALNPIKFFKAAQDVFTLSRDSDRSS